MSDELPTMRSMSALFSQIAMLREYQEPDDPRCIEAARNLHLLAATLGEVPADVILRLNDACANVGAAVVARQIIEMVIGVGLERGLFNDATAFYETLIASVAGDLAPSPRLN